MTELSGRNLQSGSGKKGSGLGVFSLFVLRPFVVTPFFHQLREEPHVRD